MSHTLIYNCKEIFGTHAPQVALRGDSLNNLPSINYGYIIIENDIIKEVGEMSDLLFQLDDYTTAIDAKGKMVFPAWCDSHTHLVFAASREDEFISKLQGASYAEIAAKGGGILNSALKVQEASEDFLFETAIQRLKQVAALGTGAIEIKSGYGLTADAELKMLRVIKRLKQYSPVLIKSTFLGAHAYPLQYKDDHEGYLTMIIDEMLPQIGEQQLADYVDVFCEEGFFSVREMNRVCEAARQYGLKPKLHVNQLNSLGAVSSAVQLNALSVDHLEVMTNEDISALAGSTTIGTLIPTAAFFLRMNYQPARQLINANCAIALASDFNPGSSPSGNMNLVGAVSCIQMKMLPAEVINAMTINGSFAMETEKQVGSISSGKKANLVITKPIPSLAYYFYSFGEDLIDQVLLNGKPAR